MGGEFMVLIVCGMIIGSIGGWIEELYAQSHRVEKDIRYAAYVEVFGGGLLFSLNADGHISTGYGLRIGGFYSEEAYWFFAQGLMLTNPDGNHHLEVGGGLGVMAFALNLDLLGSGGGSSGPPEPKVYFPLHLGYRFQQSDGGFLLRLGFTPLLMVKQTTNEWGILPWGGLSLGWSW
ncbi:MAG: hypothetical protein NZ606_05025 [Candidatus Kapabacteria bacterium]|nr:hypothetical protein [Candidatus Kapabacteria bacterium]